MRSVRNLCSIVFFIIAGCSGIAQAGQTKAVLHGRVMSVPCYINSRKALDFDFGRVGINKVGGQSQSVTTDVPVTCDKNMNSNLLIKISGTPFINMKANVLKTNVSNLGVALYDDIRNKELPLETEWLISNSQVFRIKAVLVKEDETKTLEAKPFTVTATVVAFYE